MVKPELATCLTELTETSWLKEGKEKRKAQQKEKAVRDGKMEVRPRRPQAYACIPGYSLKQMHRKGHPVSNQATG